jgi:hypothetical protein
LGVQNWGLHTLISKLEIETKANVSSQIRLGEHYWEFYPKRYIRETCRQNSWKAQMVFIKNFSNKIPNQLNQSLGSPII